MVRESRERRKVLSVIGSSSASVEEVAVAKQLGTLAVDAGFRIVTGGLGGVMEAASLGARSSVKYREGDVVGVLPSNDKNDANVHCDFVIPTGLGHARNVLVVACGDVVIAVGGSAGTLSELALAWQLGKPIVALELPGWSGVFAEQTIDTRRRDVVHGADSAERALELACQLLERS